MLEIDTAHNSVAGCNLRDLWPQYGPDVLQSSIFWRLMALVVSINKGSKNLAPDNSE